MSSSTSNSSPKSRYGLRWRVIIFVVLVFVGVEVFTRTKLFQMSADFRRFNTYPARAAELAQHPGLQVVLVGNSTTDEGIDADVLQNALNAPKINPISVEKFTADSGRVQTWYFMMQRYFWRPGYRPNLVILNFQGNWLEDGTDEEIGRLAQFFTTSDDWPEVFRTDLPRFSQRAEFVLSAGWATFAARDRLKERVLSVAVPGYQDYTWQAHLVNSRHAELQAGVKQSGPVSYKALQRLLRRAQELDCKLCFVAFPRRFDLHRKVDYQVSAEPVRLIRSAGMAYVDLRQMQGLSAACYTDGLHLNEKGRPVYSRRLAQEIAPILAGLPTSHKIFKTVSTRKP